MPWHIEKDGDQFEVVKNSDGKVVGKHPTKDKAKRHLAALYASERKR
jgi:hypothetical protein